MIGTKKKIKNNIQKQRRIIKQLPFLNEFLPIETKRLPIIKSLFCFYNVALSL